MDKSKFKIIEKLLVGIFITIVVGVIVALLTSQGQFEDENTPTMPKQQGADHGVKILREFPSKNVVFYGQKHHVVATCATIYGIYLYVGGYTTENNDYNQKRGILLRYSLPLKPMASPDIEWFGNVKDVVEGIVVTNEFVYFAGSSFYRTKDFKGDKEEKGFVLKLLLKNLGNKITLKEVWAKQTPDPPGAFDYGGYETLSDITMTNEKGAMYIYVLGRAQPGFHIYSSQYITKLDNNGKCLFTENDYLKAYKVSYSSPIYKKSNSIGRAIISFNGYIYTGGMNEYSGVGRANLIKYDDAGKFIYSNYSTPGTYYSIVEHKGAIYAVGKTSSEFTKEDFLIEKWSEEGVMIWSQQYDYKNSRGADILYGVTGIDSKIYAVGITKNKKDGDRDVVILKIEGATGEVLTYKEFGGYKDDFGKIVLFFKNSLYVIGDTMSLHNRGQEIFIVKYDL
jgi:hypothetical protein